MQVLTKFIVKLNVINVNRNCTTIEDPKIKSLSKGQRVYVQNNNNKTWESGTVKNFATRPRSYEVELDSGSAIQRNRKFLNPLSENIINEKSVDDSEVDNVKDNIPATVDDTVLDETLDGSFATPSTFTNTTISFGREVKPPSLLQIQNTMNKNY